MGETEQARLRAENARLRRRLAEVERLAAASAAAAEDASRVKDEFLATVSHEIRTPLSAILGWAAILRSGRRRDPASIAKGVEIIERNARSQLRIIDDILDGSRLVRGQLRIRPEPVDLARIAREACDSVRPAADAKGIRIELVGAHEPCGLVGDPERLRQVVWNLLANALKFTPDAGAVTVRLETIVGRVVVAVTDTGIGIDPDFLPHVFERFRQAAWSATRSSGGLGLGLAIVRHLVEMHGGTVAAASDGPGLGSTFTFTLPVRPFTFAEAGPTGPAEDPPLRHDDENPPPSRVLAGRRLLVVEDDADSRELIELLLVGEGATVAVAGSAAEALRLLDGFAPEVLVSDIGMPDQDGYWLIGEVRGRCPGLPAVALTAFTRREDVRRAREAGFDEHVAKPVDPERLIRLVAACLRSAGGRPAAAAAG